MRGLRRLSHTLRKNQWKAAQSCSKKGHNCGKKDRQPEEQLLKDSDDEAGGGSFPGT